MSRKKIPEKIVVKVRQDAKNRCGYCLSHQDFIPIILQVDHISPLDEGGTDDEENLWLLCGTCNRAKSNKVSVFDKVTQTKVLLFNPRNDNWHEHFSWSEDGIEIIGKTATGRATVSALNLNRDLYIIVRRNWIIAGWHPPKE
ncbi:MAG TPA: HNH endonuclease signature motif containing protein [Pyrinomonadaceae bacterium]|jgi:hypothetical protein